MTLDKKTIERLNAQQKWALSGKPLTLEQRVEMLETKIENLSKEVWPYGKKERLKNLKSK